LVRVAPLHEFRAAGRLGFDLFARDNQFSCTASSAARVAFLVRFGVTSPAPPLMVTRHSLNPQSETDAGKEKG
jgi:hypothetical protein